MFLKQLGMEFRTIAVKLTDKVWSSETTVMTILAVLIGASTGLGIAIFRRDFTDLRVEWERWDLPR